MPPRRYTTSQSTCFLPAISMEELHISQCVSIEITPPITSRHTSSTTSLYSTAHLVSISYRPPHLLPTTSFPQSIHFPSPSSFPPTSPPITQLPTNPLPQSPPLTHHTTPSTPLPRLRPPTSLYPLPLPKFTKAATTLTATPPLLISKTPILAMLSPFIITRRT